MEEIIPQKANEGTVSGISDQLYGYADVYYASRKQIFLRQVSPLLKICAQKIIFTKILSTETLMALFSVARSNVDTSSNTALMAYFEVLLLEYCLEVDIE